MSNSKHRSSLAAVIGSQLFLIGTSPAFAQVDPYGIFDFEGEVTTLTPGLSGDLADYELGDSVFGQIRIDLTVAPIMGPGGEWQYTADFPYLTLVVGNEIVQRGHGKGPGYLVLVDGQAPNVDSLSYQFTTRYWNGAQIVNGTARFRFEDTGGDAWSTSALEMLPFPLRPDAGLGQSATLEVLDSMGSSVLEATLHIVELDLSNESHCTPILNSTGRPGRLTGLGSRVVADNSFSIFADRLPQDSFGLFITSLTEGFVANPGGQQGNLCLNGMIGRFLAPGQVQSSGSAGTMLLDVDLTQLPTVTGFTSVSAGETRYFQLWHRDAYQFGSHVQVTSNFTSSLAISFQ